MTRKTQSPYDLIWNHENQFAFTVARQVLEKPKISVWIILIPVLFLYYAHKIQQYKAAMHDFSRGLMRSKILALDSAKEELDSGRKNSDYEAAFESGDLEGSPNGRRVREMQIAEVMLLKSHYSRLLGNQGSNYQTLVKKTYRTGADYRQFLNQLARAEEAVNDAVLRAFHPEREAREVIQKMQEATLALREKEITTFFG
ncbi:MAG: NF038143 family protein [Desulfotignum sp.]